MRDGGPPDSRSRNSRDMRAGEKAEKARRDWFRAWWNAGEVNPADDWRPGRGRSGAIFQGAVYAVKKGREGVRFHSAAVRQPLPAHCPV